MRLIWEITRSHSHLARFRLYTFCVQSRCLEQLVWRIRRIGSHLWFLHLNQQINRILGTNFAQTKSSLPCLLLFKMLQEGCHEEWPTIFQILWPQSQAGKQAMVSHCIQKCCLVLRFPIHYDFMNHQSNLNTYRVHKTNTRVYAFFLPDRNGTRCQEMTQETTTSRSS